MSLWLFEATERLLEKTGLDDDFVRETLYPVLASIFERVASETAGDVTTAPRHAGGPALRLHGVRRSSLEWEVAQ